MPSVKYQTNALPLEKLSGVVTWLVVASMTLSVMFKNDLSSSRILIACALYSGYIVLWLVSVTERKFKHDGIIRISVLGVLFMIVIAIFFTVPMSFNSILIGILCGAFPYYMSIKRSLVLGSLMSLPLYFIYTYYWQNDFMVLTTSLFWTFNMFAIVMVNASVREKEAREKAEEVNRQLISTQVLLSEASKQGERLRIARNIHDLIGHHLTALTINLQVAERQTEGDIKTNIERCHQLAKLLLSDVRIAVSDIREKSQVDLHAAIDSIVEQVPSLNIDVNIADDIHLDDISVADTLIKCIQESVTNTLKHANASSISISLTQIKSKLTLRIENDGHVPSELTLGNGLKGMQERVHMLKGSIDFAPARNKLSTTINIPTMNEEPV